MTYIYTAIRTTPPGPNVGVVGEAFECTASCESLDDKHDVIHITSINEVSPIVVASIPINKNNTEPNNSTNWVERLLGMKTLPVFPTSITVPFAAIAACSFDTATYALIMGQIVMRFAKKDYAEGNFVLGIRNSENNASAVRPIRDAIVFQSDSVNNPVIGYTQSNIIAIYSDVDNQPKQFMMALDKPIPFSEVALMFLRDKTLNVLEYIDYPRGLKENDTLEAWRYTTRDGKVIATWFTDRSGKFQFITARDEITNLVLAAQDAIRNSGRDDIAACFHDFTEEYLTIVNESPNRDADVIELCMKYIHV